MPDPTLSDIDFKNKMAWVWTTFKDLFFFTIWILMASFGDDMSLGIAFFDECTMFYRAV